MPYFSSDIRMKGDLTYSSFLNLAKAANAQSDTIANRTVRLIQAGNGLTTTTDDISVSKARHTQIDGARMAFLDAIQNEFGIHARDLAHRLLSNADGKGTPLTGRNITAVDQEIKRLEISLGISPERKLIAKNYTDFLNWGAEALMSMEGKLQFAQLAFREIEDMVEVMLKDKDRYPANRDGVKAATKEASVLYAVRTHLEALLKNKQVPERVALKAAPLIADDVLAYLRGDANNGIAPTQIEMDAYARKKADELHAQIRDLDETAREFDNLSRSAIEEADAFLQNTLGKNAVSAQMINSLHNDIHDRLDSLDPCRDVEDIINFKKPEADFLTDIRKIVRAETSRVVLPVLAGQILSTEGGPLITALNALGGDQMDVSTVVYELDAGNFMNVERPPDDAGKGLFDVAAFKEYARRFSFFSILDQWGSAQKIPAGTSKAIAPRDAIPALYEKHKAKLLAAKTPEAFRAEVANLKNEFLAEVKRLDKIAKDAEGVAMEIYREPNPALEEIAKEMGQANQEAVRKLFDRVLNSAISRVVSAARNTLVNMTLSEIKENIRRTIQKKLLGAPRESIMDMIKMLENPGNPNKAQMGQPDRLEALLREGQT